MKVVKKLKRLVKGLRPDSHQQIARPNLLRVCQFEQMESRELLAADPLFFGAVYYEDASGTDFDTPGDLIYVSFEGGAEQTQLDSISINTDPFGGGLTEGDVFFDTNGFLPGASGHVPYTVVENTGIDQIIFHQSSDQIDGQTIWQMSFVGFDAGDRLVLGVDVDEVGDGVITPTVEGKEFEGTMVTAVFTADTYYDSAIFAEFSDSYTLGNEGLNLPPDSYIPPGTSPAPDFTAGTVESLTQRSLPMTISGKVYLDDDLDNTLDAGEAGIEGFEVELYRFNDDLGTYVSTGQTDTTDSEGDYLFNLTEQGRYQVFEHQSVGFFSVGATAGNVDGDPRGIVFTEDIITQIDLVGGEDSVGNNFAESLPGSISGTVYHDQNDNGLIDNGELGIANVTVELLDVQGDVIATTQSDADGNYEFNDLQYGTFSVREDFDEVPNGYLDGKDTPGSAGGSALDPPGDLISGIVLGSATHSVENNFGELRPGSISGHVHGDANGDCEYDPAVDIPLAGVEIMLYQGNTLVDTQLTDADGIFRFDGLQPGTYRIQEGTTDDYLEGSAYPGSAGGIVLDTNNITDIVIGSDADAIDYNFCEHVPSSIEGYVYNDLDDDGIRELGNGEVGIADVWMDLYDDSGALLDSAQTDVNGFYRFDDLYLGTYQVTQRTQPTPYLDGKNTPGSTDGTSLDPVEDAISDITIDLAQASIENNFGELEAASISGLVIVDNDADSVIDPEDTPLENIEIYLYNDSGVLLDTTSTDENGAFIFSGLLPGSYSITEGPTPGFLDGPELIGTQGGLIVGPDSITAINLVPGDQASEYAFLEIPPASISGYVFQDGETALINGDEDLDVVFASYDGQRTPDDTPLAGVTIELYQEGEGLIATTVTDANGYYEFTGLAAGQYAVVEIQPEGFISWIVTPGPQGAGQLSTTPDRIELITLTAGLDSEENNFSEVRTELLPPPPENPPPILPPPPVTPPIQPPPASQFTVLRTPVILPPTFLPPIFGLGIPQDGGGGLADEGNTWHLSVVNSGAPRGIGEADNAVAFSAAKFEVFSWSGANMNHGRWSIQSQDVDTGEFISRQIIFGSPGSIPITGDFNGDGITDVGVFLNGEWFVDIDGNGIWDERDFWLKLGREGDLPITGDWDGDGKTDIGIWGAPWNGDSRMMEVEGGIPAATGIPNGMRKNMPQKEMIAPNQQRMMKKTSRGGIRADVIDHVFAFGKDGDAPISGDWNGDGTDKIGVYRDGKWYLDVNGNGRWEETEDMLVELSIKEGRPVVGDFNGDGIDDVGLYNAGKWFVDSNGDHRVDQLDKVFELGTAADIPIVGDWNGDGVEEPGVFNVGPATEDNSGDNPAPEAGKNNSA